MESNTTIVRSPHLHLTEWPFHIVPNEVLYPMVADRTELRKDVRTLLRNMSRKSTSSMHLMWAWFGAGKTHALHHITHLCQSEEHDIIPIYLEFPRATRRFLDLYRFLINGISLKVINDAYLEVFTSPLKNNIQIELQSDFPDLSNALLLLYQGKSSEQNTVLRWLRTEIRDVGTLRTVGIARPIATAEDAIRTITWLIRLISLGSSYSNSSYRRILWMIDEFQRIKECGLQVRNEICSCLSSVFNRCPDGLSIMISFTGRPEQKKMPSWLSEDIIDRIGIEKVLLLPPLATDDALVFVRDLLQYFRNPQFDNTNEFFPFSEETARTIIDVIHEKKAELKPRTIMQFFSAVLEEADIMIENGSLDVITPAFAQDVLKGRVFLDQEE